MKTAIHPEYHSNITVKCVSCDNEFITGSTQAKVSIEVCSQCHPFFTGKQRLVDSARRVEKFKQRTEAQATLSKDRVTKKEKNELRAKKQAEKSSNQ